MRIVVWVILLIPVYSVAQISIGPSVGLFASRQSGAEKIDSIQIISDNHNNKIPFVGVKGEYQINTKLSIQSEISFLNNSLGFIVYNADEVCAICPEIKVMTLGVMTVDFPIIVALKLPNPLSRIKVRTGIGPTFNITKRRNIII